MTRVCLGFLAGLGAVVTGVACGDAGSGSESEISGDGASDTGSEAGDGRGESSTEVEEETAETEAGDATGDSSGNDVGSLCACREVDGVEQCCFGHGQCVDQEVGPRRCACEDGAIGELCSTPGPGVHAVPERACEVDDPGCHQLFTHVAVEHYDACTLADDGAIASVIVRPAADAGGAWPDEAPLPLAILVHGASQSYTDYYDLIAHLAANGTAVASIDGTWSGDVPARAERLSAYAECIMRDWSQREHLDGRVALLGHSRGGSAAAVASRQLRTSTRVEVETVVSLAPASYELFDLDHEDAPAMLFIQGARDPDTAGVALSWFDRAGDESGLAAATPTKSLVWIYGATHHRFHQGFFPAGGEQVATIGGEAHWTLARAYIGGFLRWQLHGETELRKLFRENTHPDSVRGLWPGADTPVYTQYVQGYGPDQPAAHRRALHDFEGEDLTPSAQGVSVEFSGFEEVQLTGLTENNLPYSGLQHGQGLALRWTPTEQPPSLRFTLPPAIDAGDYTHLSFRVGQPFDRGEGDCEANNTEANQVIRIRLFTASAEHSVSTDTLAIPIVVPEFFAPRGLGLWLDADCHAVDYLRSVHVPLTVFSEAGVALSELMGVELGFLGAEGELVLDSLALSTAAQP